MPFLALVCAYAKVFMTDWHPFPSRISGRFIGTTDTTNSGSDSSSGGDGTTSFSTFLFRTFGIGVQVTSGDLDLLRRL